MFIRVGLLAWMLACGGLAFAQEPRAVGTGVPPPQSLEGVHFLRSETCTIPFTPNPEVAPTLVQVVFSADKGRSWRKLTEARSDKNFKFKSPRDGEYWFDIRSLDYDASATRNEPRSPQLRVVIDTQPPRVNLTADPAANGEVLVTWQAADEYLNTSSLRLEYQVGSKDEWTPVEIDSRDVAAIAGGVGGRAHFLPPPGARMVMVRVQVRDRAGNVATVPRQVLLSGSGVAAGGPSSALKAMVPIAADPLPAEKTRPDLSPPGFTARPQRPLPESGPPSREMTGSGAFGDSKPVEKPAEKTGPGRFAGFPRETESAAPNTLANDAPPATTSVERTAPTPEVDPYSEHPRLISKKRFNLDYDVESVGVSGVAEVELWGTNDRGQTWAKWGVDPDLKSPLEVDVSNESVYGFRIVVVGRNGLTSTRPKPGDSADVWVQIDATAPQCRLNSVTYGQGDEAGKLDIRWDASDDRLGDRPVTLLMSDRADGGWSVVAAGLPNSGQYLWPYDPRAPQQIYLRLEVRDEAGNVGVYQLSEPIRVEGLTPKGRIRNVAPIETGASPFRTPLFK